MPDGVSIPGGPVFIGLPQPPDVPCDPAGDGWRGPPGPVGPQGVPGMDGGALSGLVNVLEHGAKGDGTTDDTAAIQSVLNAYAGKAVVFIPDTGNSYRVSKLAVPSGADLLIHGTVMALPGTDVVFDLNNVHNVTMRGHGTIDGGFTTPTSGLNVCINTHGGTSNVNISGLTLQNSTNFGLAVTASSYVYVDSVRILNCVNANGFNWSQHCWITRSYISGSTVSNDDAWAFYGACNDCGISDCEITGARVSGISVYADGTIGNGTTGNPATNIVIANNISHDNQENGIEVRSREPPIILHAGIIITGNRCYANSQHADAQCADIWVSSAQGVTISGNNLSGSGGGTYPAWGIWVGQHASHVHISGNTIYNEGTGTTLGVGIYLQIPNYVLISGNYIYDDQTPQTMATGIDGSAGSHTTIVGNFIGNFSAGTSINMTAAADTVVVNGINGTWVAEAAIAIDAAAAHTGMLQYKSNSVMRWFAGTDGVNETGGNVGNGYEIIAVADDGVTLHPALNINRATQVITLAKPPVITTLPTNAANDAAAASAGVPVGGTYRSGSALMVRVV